MNKNPILTIAVPIFNMEWCLEKNLATYADARLVGKLEVLCLNNASEDGSKAIVERFVERMPGIFHLVDRDNRGYGSSINEAISAASGRYFRIVDADDWVDTEALLRLVERLDGCEVDVVLTDYQTVSMKTGKTTAFRAGDRGVEYGRVYDTPEFPMKTLPSIHGTTYKLETLRSSGFSLQDKTFFVDEEYVSLVYLSVHTIIYLDLDVYRYQVEIPTQTMSVSNRSRLRDHKERVIRRMIGEYQSAKKADPGNAFLPYCELRIKNLLGDHFTTLLIYVPDRKAGRAEADAWKAYILQTVPEMWGDVRRKAAVLYLLNRLHVSVPVYRRVKKAMLGT